MHDADCFALERVLVCGEEEEDQPEMGLAEDASGDSLLPVHTGHVHTDACYEEQKVLTCQLEDTSIRMPV